MKKLIQAIHSVNVFILAEMAFLFLYDKKHLKSKWFKSKHREIGAVGWDWAVLDLKHRLFSGKNRGVRFPISPNLTISNSKNIIFYIDSLNIFQGFGNYYQMFEDTKIFIGKKTWMVPNVGLITTNHDLNDLDHHSKCKDIIGYDCWIEMDSIILPGACLGNHTM